MKLKAVYIILIIIATIVLIPKGLLIDIITSWDKRWPSDAEVADAIKQAKFDHEIIQNYEKYAAHRNLLINNLDTIHEHRTKMNTVLVVGENKKRIKKDDCYNFFMGGNPRYDLESLPESLRAEFESSWEKIGNDCNFTICDDGTISIFIKADDVKHRLHVSHKLVWPNELQNYSIYGNTQDTMLNNGCIYIITAYVSQGW